jgi:hypothetical protein
MYDRGRQAREEFGREERGVGVFYIILRSARPRLRLGRNNGEVCVAKSFVHTRPKDACEVSDVNGQGYLATEFWLRQSSSLEVGVKKITIFISGVLVLCAAQTHVSAPSKAISGNKRRTPNLTEVVWGAFPALRVSFRC